MARRSKTGETSLDPNRVGNRQHHHHYPPPPTPQPSRRSRGNIDYLQLNDGLEEPVVTSPKSRRKKPYSPPLRAGPSASRQAASRNKCNKLDLEQLMENTPDGNKLPDLVVNREPSETLNAITNDQTTTSPDVETTGKSDGELKGITDTSLVNPSTPVTPENTELQTETIAPVTPENTKSTQDNTNDTNETNTPTPVGHDTATTDEEEAVEALLALSNLPDMDDEGNGSNHNANLMPIDGPSRSIDVNPVKVK